ncbi:MAG: hypothetical protein FWD65_08725, partial [Coriobacteriia bacterium]|nr:hypothetical protein [Coriobacteriia bacterium]
MRDSNRQSEGQATSGVAIPPAEQGERDVPSLLFSATPSRMAARRRRTELRHRLLAMALSAALLLQLIAPMAAQQANATTTTAGVGTVNASITNADNGSVAFDGSDGKASTAQMSWSQVINHIANVYNLQIILSDLPTDKANTLEVTLPLGMCYQYTTTAAYLAQAGQFANDVASSNYTRTPTISDYTSYNGTFSFTLKAGVQATTATIPIQFDPSINTDTITNAAKVTLSNETGSVAETLKQVTRTTDTGLQLNSTTVTSDYTFTDGDALTLDSSLRSFRTLKTGNAFPCMITGATVNLKLSDPRAQLINTDTSGQWALVDNGGGSYTFTYTPPAGVIYANAFTVPYAIEFPDTAGWAMGDVVTIVYAVGTQVTYKQYDENDPVGNIGSTVSTTSNIGPLAVSATTGRRTFTYQQPGEKVYVNYISNASYVSSGMTDPSTDVSFDANINCSNPDPAINDEISSLGKFTVGNAGVTDSAPKSVDIHFDSTAYGVLSVYLPYTVGATLTSIRYKTTTQPSWQTKTVNVRADTNGRAYISYVTLGLNSNRAEFITDLSYDLGVIPADTSMPNNNSNICIYCGKWLGANDLITSGIASIRVYDTTGAANDTGDGSVTTKRMDGDWYVGNVSVPQMVASAGSALTFGSFVSLSGTNSNGNATLEHPEIYIRSQVVDENGNPLPLSNIKIMTSAARVGGSEDITDYCTITHWTVDENGDGKDDAIIYKIDTTGVPDSKAALANTYINSAGSITSYNLDINYSIPTTVLTPTQSYNSRDMVFLRWPGKMNGGGLNSTVRSVTAASDPAIYASIRNGETWSTGYIIAQSTRSTSLYGVNSIQSILVTSQIKQGTGTSWLTWQEGDEPIPVGVSAGSGFELKTDIINNAGATVSGTEAYIPIPKVGQNWGSLQSQAAQLTLLLKGAATVDATAGSGTVGSYTVRYGIDVTPTDSGSTLQGYAWVNAAAVTDW